MRDYGLGFDMNYHDRIFDTCQRVHRSEACSGARFGAAIVKATVQRMGARVRAGRAPGKGAAFYLEIPE